MSTQLKTLKRFDIPSLCKFVFIIDLVLVVLFAVPFSLIWLIIPNKPPSASPLTGFVPLILIVIHPIAAAMGAAVFGALYNFAAKKIGGIKVELE